MAEGIENKMKRGLMNQPPFPDSSAPGAWGKADTDLPLRKHFQTLCPDIFPARKASNKALIIQSFSGLLFCKSKDLVSCQTGAGISYVPRLLKAQLNRDLGGHIAIRKCLETSMKSGFYSTSFLVIGYKYGSQ